MHIIIFSIHRNVWRKSRIPRHRYPREDPRQDVGVGVVECGLNGRAFARDLKGRGFESLLIRFQVTALGKLPTRMCICHQEV